MSRLAAMSCSTIGRIAHWAKGTGTKRLYERASLGNAERTPDSSALGPGVPELVRFPYVSRRAEPSAQQTDGILESPPNGLTRNDESKTGSYDFEAFEELARLTIFGQGKLGAGRSCENAMDAVSRNLQCAHVLSWQRDSPESIGPGTAGATARKLGPLGIRQPNRKDRASAPVAFL